MPSRFTNEPANNSQQPARLQEPSRALEEERHHLALDDDGPTQLLYAILFQCQLCRRLVRLDPARAERELVKLEQMLRDRLQEIQRVLHD